MPMNHPQEKSPSRRTFLRTTAQAAAAGFAFPTVIPGSALGLGRMVAASNRFALGVIGRSSGVPIKLRKWLLVLLLTFPSRVPAADHPEPTQGDFVIRDFR